MSRYTLGLCTMGNSSAAIFCDGELISAVEEERITRHKNDGRFPLASIHEVLSIAKIELSQVDEVCVYWKPWQIQGRFFETLRKIANNPLTAIHILKRVWELFFKSQSNQSKDGKWTDLFKIRKILQANFGQFQGKVTFVDHHTSHQLYAESMQDWDEFVSLSYDGGGEKYSTVLSIVCNGRRETLTKHKWPNSLGHFYATFTGFLGFKMLEGEYKMMGLAPYGEPKFKDKILENILLLENNGQYKLNTKICDYHAALEGKFTQGMINLFGKPRNIDEKPSQLHIDIAASVQAAFEDALIHVLKPAFTKGKKIEKLVISGGCALNVTANGKLIANNLFKEIIIPPAPHDAGCAIGACLASLPKVNLDSIRMPYTGRVFTDDQIKISLENAGFSSNNPLPKNEFISRVVELLSEGKIIAWFQGAAEFGPRALGNRSYLADPRNDDIRDQINEKIKKRELFRPFAPSVTIESSKDFFSFDQASPYMNIVSTVRNSSVPAITHIDNTARVHTVSALSNPLYHELITEFGRVTGVPVLLNTSFNIQEPIVYSPDDAIRTFLNSGVDALAIGKFLIDRSSL